MLLRSQRAADAAFASWRASLRVWSVNLAAVAHLKTVFDDGIVVRQARLTTKSEMSEKRLNRLFGRDRTDN